MYLRWQCPLMGIHPVDHAGMVDAEHFADASEALAFQIQTHCLLFESTIIAHRLRVRGEVDAALLASQTLTASSVEPRLYN